MRGNDQETWNNRISDLGPRVLDFATRQIKLTSTVTVMAGRCMVPAGAYNPHYWHMYVVCCVCTCTRTRTRHAPHRCLHEVKLAADAVWWILNFVGLLVTVHVLTTVHAALIDWHAQFWDFCAQSMAWQPRQPPSACQFSNEHAKRSSVVCRHTIIGDASCELQATVSSFRLFRFVWVLLV